MATVACIGHTTLDVILFVSVGHIQNAPEGVIEFCVPFPSKIPVDKRVFSLGGNAPNVGAGLRKTGNKVLLISQVGDDEIGGVLHGLLSEWNFDLSYTGVEGESNISVILSYKDDRTILSYHNGSSYHFPMHLPLVDFVYVSSLGFTDCDNIHREICEYKDNNPSAQLLYNPGKHEIKRGFKSESELIRRCHTVILNKEEAEDFMKLPHGSGTTDTYMISLLEKYIQNGVARIIITDSQNGAYASSGLDHNYHMPIFPGQVVEKTGAGDAFSSGYLSGIIEENSFEKALVYGVAQSTSVITIPGATNGLLNVEQLRERIRQFSAIPLRTL